MTDTCPHGVERDQDLGTSRGLLVDDGSGAPRAAQAPAEDHHPTGKCTCCGGQYVYDAPLEDRHAKTCCPHCQAVTDDTDRTGGLPRFVGGPADGEVHPLLPGDTPADRSTMAGSEHQGHYVLNDDGDYEWRAGQILHPFYDVPPRSVTDVDRHYRTLDRAAARRKQ